MNTLTCHIKEYIQPFERKLALREIHALTGEHAVPVDGTNDTATTFYLHTNRIAATLRRRLAYWHKIGEGTDRTTVQVRREATALVPRNGMTTEHMLSALPSLIHSNLPRNRCLRYGSHGLHEYRGKFFPQLVRSLLNIASLGDTSILLDPMCGSGTTLVEGRLANVRSYGLDINPLSVFMSSVKCAALSLRADDLTTAYNTLEDSLLRTSWKGDLCCHHLSDHDLDYLLRWFAPETLHELDHINHTIRRLPGPIVRDFYLVCLSNILRGVSWQKNDDLRIRRELHSIAPRETLTRFLSEARRSTRVMASFLAHHGTIISSESSVAEADARQAVAALPELVGKVDAIITSPPYANALPYIDTDRLSLIYFGLLSRQQHRPLEFEMIGNREITVGQRAKYWRYFSDNSALLPTVTRELIEHIDHLNKRSNSGFRRRNLAALLAKYFFDMRKTLEQCYVLLRPGGTVFLVVGNNRTTAGGQLIQIETADHLSLIAQDVGFELKDCLPMEMLVSRDIFRKNSMASESITRFTTPQ